MAYILAVKTKDKKEFKMKDGNVRVLDRNIAIIHKMRQDSDDLRTWDQKLADNVAGFLDSSKNLYIHLIIYGSWTVYVFYIYKTGTVTLALSLMGTTATLEALVFTIFVLINQRRTNSLERKNSDLHLQMSLLAEHEVTRLIRMTDQIAKHLGVKMDQQGQELEELKKDINPGQIVEKIFEHESRIPTDSTSDD